MKSYGIDVAAFHSSHYYLPLTTLAKHRNHQPDYFYDAIGQINMAIAPPGEDIITLAANAGKRVLQKIEQNEQNHIELVILATESSVDQSKAGSIQLHALLNLAPHCRCIEMKQACYSATAGLQLALAWLKDNPGKKALLIAADIAHYQQDSDAEASQGAGAVAMILSAQPRLLAIETKSGFVTANTDDFWRPNYSATAFVDGKKSCANYLKLMRISWQHYLKKSARSFADHQHFCFHVPFPALVEAAMQKLARIGNIRSSADMSIKKWLAGSLDYSRNIGNCYTGSLYLSIISLLENSSEDLTDQTIGLYSYGSGATAEYFSGQVQPGYQQVLFCNEHQRLLNERIALNMAQYQGFHQFSYASDGSRQSIPDYVTGHFKLIKIEQHLRHYTACNHQQQSENLQQIPISQQKTTV